MLIPIVFHLWNLYIIISISIGSEQQLQSQLLDITIGGVFTDLDEGTHAQNMESIFKYAIFHYNRLDRDAHNLSFKIRLQEETLGLIAFESSIQAVHDVCSLVHQRRVQGIFGPSYSEYATLIHSICYHVNIPFINVCSSCYQTENLVGDIDDDIDFKSKHDHVSINLYPSIEDLNIAFHNLTHKLQWSKFLIIYDIESGLIRLQKVLNDPNFNQTDILIRRFIDYNDRTALIDAIGRDIFNIILDLNDVNTHTILKMALQMGMINSNYHYILTTLNIDTFDLEDFKHNFVNLTSFRLFNRYDPRVQTAMDSFLTFKTMSNNDFNQRLFTTSVALWVDAVLAFAYAYDQLIKSHSNIGSEMLRPNISCLDRNGWSLGRELYLKFHQVSFEGITGRVQFTSNGERTGFELDVVHLLEKGLSKIGVWSREQGANFTLVSTSRGSIFNSTLIVTTILEAPYVMLKNYENSTGLLNITYSNNDFEGFCVDLLEELSHELKFGYKIKPITTGRYDDMVEEVKNKIADLAIAPLTRTCSSEKKDLKPDPLGLTNVGGIFVVLFGGVILSLFIAILEFLWHARKNHANRRHSVWWELIKEIRFSIQCGAPNRKALGTRRCSQCVHDHHGTELNSIPRQHRRRSCNSHSSSIGSINYEPTLKPSKNRTSIEQTSDLDKFDNALMVTSEQKNHSNTCNKEQLYSSKSSRRKSIPLIIVEQQPSSNHIQQNIRSQHVRFLKNTDSSPRESLKIHHDEDDTSDSNDVNIPLNSTSSMNSRLPLHVSRL
ncbi:unnamed protein product [Rotaria sordida]|uniref:Ionotropic glutamate receptor L-glutamate and glycine-binding domain-containing protein n=1 Tax=Rotaria sordida TaxID=392033 RepID=A0A813QX90_9BILA|nr:unnamed protein product [Rotaria sordida]CAF0828726.1 unnamed protein product [Rotaria sordida]